MYNLQTKKLNFNLLNTAEKCLLSLQQSKLAKCPKQQLNLLLGLWPIGCRQKHFAGHCIFGGVPSGIFYVMLCVVIVNVVAPLAQKPN
jgi:hypothetical protein